MGSREKILFACGIGLGAVLTFIFLFVFGKHFIAEQRVQPSNALQTKKQEAPGVLDESRIEVGSPEKERLRLKKEQEEKEAALTKLGRQPIQVPGFIAKPVMETPDVKGESQEAGTEPPEKAPDTAEKLTQEEFLKQLQKALKRYANTIPVGGELPESAKEELSLNENQASGISDALKNEAERLKQVLAEFYRDNCTAGANEDLSSVSSSQILIKMLPKMIPDLQKTAQLSALEQLQLVKGERSLLEWIPRDGFTARLAYELYKGRQKTYEELAVFLDEESLKKFTNKYLMPNAFYFPGNFNLNFGEVNWEEK